MTGLRRVAAALLAGAVLVNALPARAEVCAVPAELVTPIDGLPVVARRIAEKSPLKIVAIGSASTKGEGLTSPKSAYPERLRAELAKRLPDIAVTVVNLGRMRETAQSMVERFEKEVIPEKPALVIWQTGTVEAVRSATLDDFGQTLAQGIDMLRAAGVDVVPMNLQYSWRMALAINDQPYNDMMATISDAHDAPLFDRYGIMKHWVENGRFDFDTAPVGDRRARADAAHACLGRLLAEFVVQAADAGPAQVLQR